MPWHWKVFFPPCANIIRNGWCVSSDAAVTVPKLRRYEMGEVSGKLADLTVITSDNPRFEEPQDIINDIKIGMEKTDGKYIEICDRKKPSAM